VRKLIWMINLILIFIVAVGCTAPQEVAIEETVQNELEETPEVVVEPEDSVERERREMQREEYDFSLFPEPMPFSRGLNMGNALEAPIEGAWGMFIREEFFSIIKEAGFDHVRIPIRWSAHASETYPYEIWPGFLGRVDEVIYQALSQGLTVIINIHHYEDLMNYPEEHKARFLALWSQISYFYKDWPDNLYFSVLNEPMGNLTADLWNEYLVDVLKVIRETNPERKVVIGPANWNAVTHLAFLRWPKDDENLIATFHYYSPFEFTHQGAGWVNNPPPIGTKWTGSEAEVTSIQRDLDRALRFSQENNVTVWLAEFGAYSTADMESRALWTRTVAREAEKRGIPWSYWEFGSGFGVFDRTTNEWRTELLDALVGEPLHARIEVEELERVEWFNFNEDIQNWSGGEAQPQWDEGETRIYWENTFYENGGGSLKSVLSGEASKYKIIAPEEVYSKILPGQTLTFSVFIPENSGINAVQPFAQYNNWSGWADSYIQDPPINIWFTIDWTIPDGVVQPLNSLGIMFHTNQDTESIVFVDSVYMQN